MKHPIRKILVPLDPSRYASSATVHACEIAQKHEGRVAGLAVMDSPDIRTFVAPTHYSYLPVVQDAIASHRLHAQEEIDKMEQRFLDCCKRHKVEAVESEEEGIAVNLILNAASLFDLIVIGLRTFFHFETVAEDGDTLEEILHRTSTPILAVKDKPTNIKKVLVCYDGSVAAARAIRDFALFAEPFDFKIDVFVAEKDEGLRGFYANKASMYLVDHGLDVEDVISSKATPKEALESGITNVYDMIVCGIHSKAPIKDFFVGSFTKELIENQENCLFLSH